MRQARPQPYKVRSIHVVAKSDDVLVREYTLDAGEAIPWHRHSQVADYYYGLEGRVVVETRNPPARHELGAGQSGTVTPNTVHQVFNPAKSPCRFLLVQGVGKYDFIREE